MEQVAYNVLCNAQVHYVQPVQDYVIQSQAKIPKRCQTFYCKALKTTQLLTAVSTSRVQLRTHLYQTPHLSWQHRISKTWFRCCNWGS